MFYPQQHTLLFVLACNPEIIETLADLVTERFQKMCAEFSVARRRRQESRRTAFSVRFLIRDCVMGEILSETKLFVEQVDFLMRVGQPIRGNQFMLVKIAVTRKFYYYFVQSPLQQVLCLNGIPQVIHLKTFYEKRVILPFTVSFF